MPKSSLDWLAVGSLWLGALLFAIRSADLKAPAGAPPIVTSDIWNYAPVALVSIALILMIWRALTGSRAQSPNAVQQAPKPQRIANEDYTMLVFLGGLASFILVLIILAIIASHWPVPK